MLREKTIKALEELIAAREEVDDLLPLRDKKTVSAPDMERLCSAFTREKKAKKNYYDLLALDLNWSPEEKQEWLRGAGLDKNKPCL